MKTKVTMHVDFNLVKEELDKARAEKKKRKTSKRYDRSHVLKTSKKVELFVCPECSFSYHACHEMKDEQGGFICYRCEANR